MHLIKAAVQITNDDRVGFAGVRLQRRMYSTWQERAFVSDLLPGRRAAAAAEQAAEEKVGEAQRAATADERLQE